MMDVESSLQSQRCAFCPKEEPAKYTCPRCNANYCCTTCYQSQRHSGCSESFYKECVTEEIKCSERNPEDKRKMQEMLQRLENEDVDDGGLDSDDCDSCPDLSERLEGVDLEDHDSVWAQLNEVERAEFEKMVETGEIRKLIPAWKPWWLPTKKKLVTEVDEKLEDKGKSVPTVKTDVPPLSQLTKKAPNSVVKYGLVNVLYSYVYMMRLHNGEPEDGWVDGLLRMSGTLREGQNYDDSVMAMSSCAHALLQIPEMMEKKIKTEAERDVLNLLGSRHMVAAALSHTYALLQDSKSIYKKHQKAVTEVSQPDVNMVSLPTMDDYDTASPLQKPTGASMSKLPKRQTPYTRGEGGSLNSKRRPQTPVKSSSKDRSNEVVLTFQPSNEVGELGATAKQPPTAPSPKPPKTRSFRKRASAKLHPSKDPIPTTTSTTTKPKTRFGFRSSKATVDGNSNLDVVSNTPREDSNGNDVNINTVPQSSSTDNVAKEPQKVESRLRPPIKPQRIQTARICSVSEEGVKQARIVTQSRCLPKPQVPVVGRNPSSQTNQKEIHLGCTKTIQYPSGMQSEDSKYVARKVSAKAETSQLQRQRRVYKDISPKEVKLEFEPKKMEEMSASVETLSSGALPSETQDSGIGTSVSEKLRDDADTVQSSNSEASLASLPSEPARRSITGELPDIIKDADRSSQSIASPKDKASPGSTTVTPSSKPKLRRRGTLEMVVDPKTGIFELRKTTSYVSEDENENTPIPSTEDIKKTLKSISNRIEQTTSTYGQARKKLFPERGMYHRFGYNASTVYKDFKMEQQQSKPTVLPPKPTVLKEPQKHYVELPKSYKMVSELKFSNSVQKKSPAPSTVANATNQVYEKRRSSKGEPFHIQRRLNSRGMTRSVSSYDAKTETIKTFSDQTTQSEEELSKSTKSISVQTSKNQLLNKSSQCEQHSRRDVGIQQSDISVASDISSPRSHTFSPSGDGDFLIDDEIADQPELIGEGTVEEEEVEEEIEKEESELEECLEGATAMPAIPEELGGCSPATRRRSDSLDSLCSDDLMTDFVDYDDLSSSDRNDGESPASIHTKKHRFSFGSDDVIKEEEGSISPATPTRRSKRLSLERDDMASPRVGDIVQEWNSLIRGGSPHQSKLLRRSSEGRPPLRPQRYSLDSNDMTVRLDVVSYRHMVQDINSSKTMLLRLKRLLEERGLYWNASLSESMSDESEAPSGDLKEENAKLRMQLADLKRELLYHKKLGEEKDRTVKLLQTQMAKYAGSPAAVTTANAATQTERTRSISANLSRTTSMDSVGQTTVSLNDTNMSEQTAVETPI